jgi:hypothetical protein
MEHDSGNRQAERRIRYLLCDSSGQIEPELGDGEWVRSPIQCLNSAVEEKPTVIVVRFFQMPIRERETLVELCAVLKRNSYTKSAPVVALLQSKHRGLIEALHRVGVDFVRLFRETTLSSSRMIEIIEGLGADDRVERQFMVLCPYLHYDVIDASTEMTVCGAYLDRMVLGGSRVHEVCESIEHLRCPYYLEPRIKS